MIILGYACLGLLVGTLTGLTSSPIAATVLAAIFALAGGSILPLTKNSETERRVVGAVLAAFAVPCLLGVLGGIYIKIHQTLGTAANGAEDVYLKSSGVSAINKINMQYRNKELGPDEAYRQLWDAVHENSK